MLQLSNLEHKKLHGLTEYKDLRVERELKSGDEKLSFSYPIFDKFYNDIIEESYIKTKDNEYIVKEIHELDDWTEFVCTLNVEDLEGKAWDRFTSVEQSIIDSLKLAIVGTGWTVGHCDVKKKRTIRKTNCSSWDLVQDIKKTYMVDIQFDCINKKINIYEKLGNDKGVYFIDSLNAKKIETQRDSYEFYTRIIPLGKDGLTISSINAGKDYVENHQYSKKIKTIYWKDDRYTIKENLKTDAIAKLNELSKPRRAYKVDIVNLAKNSDNKYKILDYNLGDIITLISKDKNIREKQRIVKITEYLNDHSKDTVEIANTILSFEEMQQALQDTADTVNNVTSDNGTIDGSTVDSIQTKQIEDFKANVLQVTNFKAVNADIEHLKVNKVDAQNLNVVKERVGTLEATTINTTQFHALEGQIDFFKSNYSKIHDLEVTNEKVKIIEGKVSNFDEVLAGNITAKNIATNTITANSEIIAENAIGSSQISSLSVNKLDAGEMDTSKINLIGPLRRLKIIGDKIQILDNKDGKLYERIMLGVDEKNNSTLILRGADGKTILLNQNGLTNAGFTEGYGRVKDNTLDASKFEKNSIVRQINNATETIKSTKVQIGDRTLDIELSTQNNKITDHSKELYTQKSSINALDNAIKLKVDNQVFIKSNKDTNEKIDNINKHISDTNTNLHKATSKLDILENQISTKVSQIDINKSIESIKIGNRNLVLDSDVYITKGDKSFEFVDVKSLRNKYITISLDFDLDDAVGSRVGFEPSILFEDGTRCYFGLWVNLDNPVTLHKRLTKTYKIPDKEIKFLEQKGIYVQGIKSGNVKVGRPKLITGNLTSSDWSPAPEDTKNLIINYEKNITKKIDNVSSELNQTKNSFNLSVNDLHSKTKTIETNITSANNNINNLNTSLSNNINNLDKNLSKNISSVNKSLSDNLNSLDNNLSSKINKSKDEALSNAKNYTDSTSKKLKADVEKYANDVAIAKANLAQVNAQAHADNKITLEEKTRIKEAEENLNKALSKAKEAEKLSKNYADKVAEDKKNEAVKNSKDYTNTQIITVNTKVNNVESSIKILKNEISTKINKTDIDKTIIDINNKIKSADEKINQASSEIKQSTNALKANIEKVTSTTKTIENNLKDKANKSEVSTVSSQITTVQANLNNISQKISHTETNVNKINSDINTFNSKINSVEQKITPNSLTNTVLSSQQYKNNVNDTNFLREKFTRFQQNTDSFLLNVKNGGTNNLLLNGNFEGNLFDTWEKWGTPGEISILGDAGNKYLKLNINGSNQGLCQVVKVEPNTTYTFSCECENDNGVISIPQIASAGDYSGIEIKGSGVFSFTFTTKKNDIIFVYLGRGSGGTNGVSRWFWATLTKGDYPCDSYISNSNEINGSTIQVNKNQFRAEFSDGSYTLIEPKGFCHWHNGMAHPYHYLFHRGSVDKVNSQQTVRVYVPEEFKGKHYGISWWDGNKFPQYEGDLLFSPNVELVNRNDEEGWFDLKASLMVRNPDRGESAPAWRGKMNIIYTLIA